MESESKQTVGTNKKTVNVYPGNSANVDLETDNPDLEITLLNNGPANEIEFYVTDNRSQPQKVGRLHDRSTFKLHQFGNGRILILKNSDGQPAKVDVSW